MRTNRGVTALKRRRRASDPMAEFDRLPPELRAWLAKAAMPWSARSVRRAYKRALARTQDRSLALRELDALQARLIALDKRRLHDAARGARTAENDIGNSAPA